MMSATQNRPNLAVSLPLSDATCDRNNKIYDKRDDMQRQPWRIGMRRWKPYDISGLVETLKYKIWNLAQP